MVCVLYFFALICAILHYNSDFLFFQSAVLRRMCLLLRSRQTQRCLVCFVCYVIRFAIVFCLIKNVLFFEYSVLTRVVGAGADIGRDMFLLNNKGTFNCPCGGSFKNLRAYLGVHVNSIAHLNYLDQLNP